MNILVTGGAGYVGSHACKAPSRAGFTPVVYDNLVAGHEWAVKWGPLERGDILDRERLDSVFQQYQPSAVMHFAAYAYVGASVEHPADYYRNNVAGALAVLETMYRHGVTANGVFQQLRNVWHTSDHANIGGPPQDPISPYGASKLMVERMLADFGMAYDLRYVSLRYFNAAGADPDGEIGEVHDPETHLIPLVLEAAAGRRPDIPVFGTDYETPDGTCIRDFVHVTDLAEAHVLALNSVRSGAPSVSYNLGTGEGFSVREVIQTARSVTGCTISAREGDRRPGDPARLVADATRARNSLGWKCKHGDLPTILRTAWRWLCNGQCARGREDVGWHSERSRRRRRSMIVYANTPRSWPIPRSRALGSPARSGASATACLESPLGKRNMMSRSRGPICVRRAPPMKPGKLYLAHP